ncbi:MAG TPA: BTAD domain-containing putative transcriptional regulator [Candidatus Acidoferrales bacterium]|nr:BTAD domain-containing putative transcriptional regulator [Candidatus Acidoferrales bacterium]
MDGPAVRIVGFGGFSVLVGDQDRTAAFSGRLRRCVAHLALHDDMLDRRLLASELWPELPEAEAMANLRRRLHELSQAFAAIGLGDALERTATGVRLAPRVRDAVDVVRYLEGVRDPERALDVAELYREPVFAGVDDEFVAQMRERVRGEHLELLAGLLDRAIERGDPVAIAAGAEALARHDPSSEDAIGRAVRALRELGETDRARRLFDRFAARVRELVGVEPAEIAELRPASGLPAETTPFFERPAEVAAVSNALERARVVVLVGPPGVGKSRLASRIAAELTARYPNGVRYLDAAGHRDGASALAALAGIVRARAPDAAAIARALVETPSPLLLDNVEAIAAELEPLIAQLAAGGSPAPVLVTSRAPLRVAGECVVRVEPLERQAALAFFLARAELAGARFERTHERLTAAASICEELDCVPLALELAARRIPTLGFVNVRRLLDDRFRALAPRGERRGGRHDALRSAYDWSYDLLSPDEQRVFRALGLLRGPWTLETAASLMQTDVRAVADVVSRLVDDSLVELGRTEGAFATMRTAREYMRRRLDECGETGAYAERYARMVLEPYVAANYELRGAHAADRFDAIERSMDDVRAALDSAIVAGLDVELGARALAALSRFLFERGHAMEARRWCEAAVAQLDASSPVRAETLYVRALMGRNAGRFDAGLAEFEEAVAALRASGDAATLAKSMLYASNAARMTGNAERALDLAREASKILAGIGDPYLVAFARSAVGAANYALGNLLRARREFAAAGRAFAAIEARDDEALMLIDAARCDFGMGDLIATGHEFERGLSHALQTGNRYVEAHARISLGLHALDRGRPADARRQLAPAAAIALATNDVELSVIALEAAAELFAAENARERAVIAAAAANGVRAQACAERAPSERARYERLQRRVGGVAPPRGERSFDPGARMRSILGSFSEALYEVPKTERRR